LAQQPVFLITDFIYYTSLVLNPCHAILFVFQQSNQVGGSAHMEEAALMHSLSFWQQSGLSVDAIVTDRHPAIQKYLRDAVPSVHHYYAVWHVAKGKLIFFGCRTLL